MIIPFCKSSIGQEEIDAVVRVMKSGWLCAAKETEMFEKEFAKYVGVKYAIYTNSGTSALKMAYKYFKEEWGVDTYEIVTGKNTFCATYSAAEEMGLEESITNLRDWISVSVHYGGVKSDKPCDLEDSAHRIEPNDPLIGKIRIYSFYVTKNMTTGAGGMFVTNNKEIYEKARLYWKDGLSTSTKERLTKGYDYKVLAMAGGYDGNDIGAAIGRVQLKRLPEFNRRRNEIVGRYNEAFGQSWSGNHLYPYFVKREKDVHSLITFLGKEGISTGYHYPGPQKWLGVSLPLYPLLTNKEVGFIIDSVKQWNLLNEKKL